jgi:hypothetical protein
MDPAYVPVLAALAGSAIGALASFATTWVAQSTQARAMQRTQDRERREALYGEFIREASRLFVDAFEHEMDDPAKLVQLYAIVSTIRLFGHPRTLQEAERVMNGIGAAYSRRTRRCACSPTSGPAASWTRSTPSARPAAQNSTGGPRGHGGSCAR